MTSSFDFSSLAVVRIPVTGPDGVQYELVEASGAAIRQFTNAQSSGIVLGPDGKPRQLEKIGDLDPLLVTLCLKGKDQRPVHQTTIENWPGRVVKQLAEKAREISGLSGPAAKDPLKEALYAALCHGKSPVSLKEFKQHLDDHCVGTLYEPLKKLLSEEDALGNSQTSTTNG